MSCCVFQVVEGISWPQNERRRRLAAQVNFKPMLLLHRFLSSRQVKWMQKPPKEAFSGVKMLGDKINGSLWLMLDIEHFLARSWRESGHGMIWMGMNFLCKISKYLCETREWTEPTFFHITDTYHMHILVTSFPFFDDARWHAICQHTRQKDAR